MPFKFVAALLLLFAIVGSSHAFEKGSSDITGSVVSDPVSPNTDSLGYARVPGPLSPLPAITSDTLSSGKHKPAPVSQGETHKLQLIKRKYNSRQQVLLATGMMLFVVGIMTMAQQWNPR
jgi:hypothetical protein